METVVQILFAVYQIVTVNQTELQKMREERNIPPVVVVVIEENLTLINAK